jgi:hypothetical protein
MVTVTRVPCKRLQSIEKYFQNSGNSGFYLGCTILLSFISVLSEVLFKFDVNGECPTTLYLGDLPD